MHGVSFLVIGNWLGLWISKPDDNHVNANGGLFWPEVLVVEAKGRCWKEVKSDTAI
jgi:hypothetical protein